MYLKKLQLNAGREGGKNNRLWGKIGGEERRIKQNNKVKN